MNRVRQQSQLPPDSITIASAKPGAVQNLLKGEKGGVITKCCPFWISYVDGKFVPNEHAKSAAP